MLKQNILQVGAQQDMAHFTSFKLFYTLLDDCLWLQQFYKGSLKNGSKSTIENMPTNL
uniref:Uncharacterized protein n=1 Tax=Physcomitrium patens TaxID=3218 RepID=A0A2K1LAG9_PHYPA|nr:hypothetical protein PHYPA_001440 [Physcomitrium patens]